MLLYSTQRAVFKNGDKCTLLCDITLPCGAEDEVLGNRVLRFYKSLYDVIYSSAKDYASRITPQNGRLIKLDVKCEHRLKRGKLLVKRTCTIRLDEVELKKRVFVDKFHINVTKQRNIP